MPWQIYFQIDSLSNKQAILKEWLPIAKDENTWQDYIEIFFNSCNTTNEHDEHDEGEEVEDDPASPEGNPEENPLPQKQPVCT